MANKKTLEASFKKLEDITSQMEKNEVTLEKSLKLYKDGIAEAKYCTEVLKNIEQEVFVLQKDINDVLKLTKFND